jgi:hypothetical protein
MMASESWSQVRVSKIYNREYNTEVIVEDKEKDSFIPRAIPLRNRSAIFQTAIQR